MYGLKHSVYFKLMSFVCIYHTHDIGLYVNKSNQDEKQKYLVGHTYPVHFKLSDNPFNGSQEELSLFKWISLFK